MAKIRIGLAGCGFVSELHMYAYRRVYGVDVEVKAVAARGDHVVDFARRHQIPTAYRSFRDLIADREMDVVDICTPPNLHASMIVDAMQAGKHVISEKPFAGYFGREDDKVPIGKYVPKAVMYQRVLEEMENTCAAIKKTGKLFMYAEDWIYAPAVTKTVEVLRATKDKILFMKGEESHSGSHAAHAAQWAMTGGGSLIRMGCHPLSAVLHLKQVEANSARPGDQRCERDLRRRQCLGVPEGGRTSLHQGQSNRRRGLGHAHRHLLRRHQGDCVLRRHDHGRRAQPH
jgi:predicted dehydrogenase